MAKIVVIVGNPLRESYCEALGQAYFHGATRGGHEARLFTLATMEFDAILRGGYREAQALEPDLVAAREAFLASDHVVFVFPLWLGDMPALMKGFLERLTQPDLLKAHGGGNASWKMFKGKSARVIMTMGMPGWFYRWYYGAHALKLLTRNILHFTGISPVRSSIFGMIEAVGDAKRRQWLREVEALGYDAA